MLKNISLRKLSLGFTVASLVFVLAVIYALSLSRNNLFNLKTAWLEFNQVRSPKIILLSHLHKAMGYNGMIHDFKNYIIRNENRYENNFQRHAIEAIATINSIRALTSDSEVLRSLDEIKFTIEKYQKNLRVVRNKITYTVTLPEELDQLVKVDDTHAISALETIESIFHKHKNYTHLNKPHLLVQLNKKLGYGGFIHYFKNYVLRKDERHLVNVSNIFNEINDIISNWKTLTHTENEEAALNDLSRVVSDYKENIKIVRYKSHLGAKEVDRLIRVDDKPAVIALEQLEYEIEKQVQFLTHEIDEEIHKSLRLEKILLILIPIFMLGSIFLGYILLQNIIINPVSRISETMDKLSGGDFTHDIPEVNSNNEIGKMARTLSTFKDTAVNYAESEKTLAAAMAEHELAREEAEKASAEKSQFVSTMSHELRTPLVSIKGTLGLLANDAIADPGMVKELLVVADRNADRLSRLINDLLDFEKLQREGLAYTDEQVEITTLVKNAIQMEESYSKQYNVDIIFNKNGCDGKSINVDPHRIQQVISNILSNAIKYSPENERVVIETVCKDKTVRVNISDKGKGIDNKYHDKIFSHFTQADASDTREKGGTGLGLAIAKQIIEHYHGVIDFDSKEGKGTTFYFELDLDELLQR